MSVSSVNSSNSYSYLQWPALQDGVDSSSGADASTPSDPLQALFQSFSGGSSSDPLVSAAGQDDGDGSSPGFQFSPGMMQALLSVQSGQAGPSSQSGSVFAKFDADGDGQISQSEFENAIGSNADKSKVDELFSKLDANGDGAITGDEMKTAMQKAHGRGHHHHHTQGAGSGSGADPLQQLLSGASADGTTSQLSSNADGSTTTTITYSDGTKLEMTVPGASNDGSSNGAQANPEAPNLASMLKQLINLQAQLATPTTSLSV